MSAEVEGFAVSVSIPSVDVNKTPITITNDSDRGGSGFGGYENMLWTEFECNFVSVFLFTCSILGSVFNLLVASVYIQKSPKCTYEIFVLFLAFINLGGCSGLVAIDYWFIFSSFETCNQPPDFTTQLSMFMECASVLMLLNIAIDRYLSIRWAVYQIMTPRRAYAMCGAAIIIACSVACLPGFLDNDEESMLKLHLYYPIVTGLVFLFICLLYLSLFWTVNQSARKAKAKRKERIKAAGHHGAKASSSMGGLGTASGALNNSLSVSSSGKCHKGRVTISAQNSNNIEVVKNEKLLSPEVGSGPSEGCSSSNVTCAIKRWQPEECLSGAGVTTTASTTHSPVPVATSADNQKKPIELMRDRTVIILLFVFGTYALCFIPITILNLMFYIKQEMFMDSTVNEGRIYKSLQMLYYLNFVLTTFVYSILSQNFRDDTKKFYEKFCSPKLTTRNQQRNNDTEIDPRKYKNGRRNTAQTSVCIPPTAHFKVKVELPANIVTDSNV